MEKLGRRMASGADTGAFWGHPPAVDFTRRRRGEHTEYEPEHAPDGLADKTIFRLALTTTRITAGLSQLCRRGQVANGSGRVWVPSSIPPHAIEMVASLRDVLEPLVRCARGNVSDHIG